MKALLINADKSVEYREIPEPVLEQGKVIVDVEVCGLCGSDLHMLKGTVDWQWNFPVVFGHEFTGVVSAAAKDVTAFKTGDRVVVFPLVSCGKCRMCQKNRPNVCSAANLIGAEWNGGFAEKVIVPADYLIKVPDGVNLADTSIIEPLATVVRGINRSRKKHFENAMVFGTGTMGLLSALVLLERADRVAVCDISDERLAVAKKLGIECTVNLKHAGAEEEIMKMTGGADIEMCVDAVGISSVREMAVRLLEPGGEMLCIANGHHNTPIDYFKLVNSELTLYGVQCYQREDFDKAMQLIERGIIDSGKFSVTYPLSEACSVIDEIRKGKEKGIKVRFNPRA